MGLSDHCCSAVLYRDTTFATQCCVRAAPLSPELISIGNVNGAKRLASFYCTWPGPSNNLWNGKIKRFWEKLQFLYNHESLQQSIRDPHVKNVHSKINMKNSSDLSNLLLPSWHGHNQGLRVPQTKSRSNLYSDDISRLKTFPTNEI